MITSASNPARFAAIANDELESASQVLFLGAGLCGDREIALLDGLVDATRQGVKAGQIRVWDALHGGAVGGAQQGLFGLAHSS